jgi:hypothetical protein
MSDSQTITSPPESPLRSTRLCAGRAGRGGRAGRCGVPVELAAVHLGDGPGAVEDRHDHAAVEVLVAGLAQHPEALQAPRSLGALLGLAVGQAVGEGAVGMAQRKTSMASGSSMLAGRR